MKVLHTFTLQSPDNAFGGPIRVALNLAHELSSRGVEVEFLGGSRGYSIAPDQLEGVPANLFAVRQIHPKLGFSGMVSAKLWSWAWRNVRKFDVVHIHLARDLITLPVAFICQVRKVPYVIQGHGMIDPTNRLMGRILDSLFVKRVLKQAKRNLYLTEQEQLDYSEVFGQRLANLEFLPNGVPIPQALPELERTQVSYISRLQARKRPTLFVEMAEQLVQQKIWSSFQIAGADEGELSTVLQRIEDFKLGPQVQYVGPKNHDQVLEQLAQTQVLVLPSVNEPFPMIVLEALAAEVPVVITDSCGLAPYISRGKAGIVTDGSVKELVDATQEILADQANFAKRAKELAVTDFSMTSIGDKLLQIYRTATGH